MTPPSENGPDSAVEVETQRRFNDLRRELLDSRMKTVDWWLAATAVFLTLLSVVAVIAGYVGFTKFREIEAEVRIHVKTAQNLVGEIRMKHDEASKILERMNAQDVSKSPNEAIRAAASVRENPQASPIDRAIATAIFLQRQGDVEGAIEKWRAVANVVDGTDNKELGARAWFSVGYLLKERNDDMESVIDAYDRAIRLKPDHAGSYNNRGNAKNKLGQYEDAIADYDKAIRLDPTLAKTYYNRGGAKNDLGRHEDAIADYDEAIRLKPDYAKAYNNRGNAKDGLGRYEDALADYDEAIRLKPDYAEAYNNRGIAKINLGQHEDAIADYDEAIRLKPDYAKSYSNRGVTKNRLGRHEDAIADHNEAIRLKPDYAEAYNNRGIANLRLGRRDSARRDFEMALSLARKAGNQTLADTVSRNLDKHFSEDDS